VGGSACYRRSRRDRVDRRGAAAALAGRRARTGFAQPPQRRQTSVHETAVKSAMHGRFPWQEAGPDLHWALVDGLRRVATDPTGRRPSCGMHAARRKGHRMNANLRNLALWVIIVLLLLALFTLFQNPGQHTSSQDIPYSQLLKDVEQGRVRDLVIQGPEIHGTYIGGGSFPAYAPSDPGLVPLLRSKAVAFSARPLQDNVPWFVQLLISWLPFIALIGVWIFLSRQMQGAGGKALGFGKSRAKLLTEAHGRVTFEDVAGV